MAPRRSNRSRGSSVGFACLATRAFGVCLGCSGAAAFAVAARPARQPPSLKQRASRAQDIREERTCTGEQGCRPDTTAVSSRLPPRGAGAATGGSFSNVGVGVGLAAGVALIAARVRGRKAGVEAGVGAGTTPVLSLKASQGQTSAWRLASRTRLAASQSPMAEKDEGKREQFRALCTTLLREVGRAEDILEEGQESLDFAEFESLLKRLEVKYEEGESRELFNMLDTDGSGTLEFVELKRNLRNSGVITEMYEEGVSNALLTLIPAAALAIFFGVTKGTTSAFDFVAGYVVEDSLSVDNLFVFLIIFKYFKVPPALQKTCLDLGIVGAVVLRAFFIFVGLAAVNSFKPVLLIFAFILLYASYTALTEGDDDDEEDEGPPEAIRSIVEAFPTTDTFVGDKLYIQDEAGKFLVTPLALCIISIELSDILFAVDSVPAVFAVTEDPAIVFTSNIAAILGLRSLYQLLSIAVQDLIYLEKSAAIILGFVGIKLVAEVAGFEISSALSLFFIIAVLGGGIVLSLLAEESKQDERKKRSTIEKIFDAATRAFTQKPQ
mmetsp:Transcript_24991/g.56683  ORF Transcript_24991/g.56683 Transcript_24991/m.56683 type:complete len:552 (-) Transcript_24991:78-1733(-)